LGGGPQAEGTIQLYVVNADGSGLRLLVDLQGYAETPAWSPDGTRIAFDLQDGAGQRIEAIDADGSHRSVIFEEPPGSGPGAPAWSPDGSKIAFVMTDADGSPDIFVMKADGSHVTQLTTDPRPDVDPVWSPDGSKIAFVRTGSGGDLFVMDSDGRNSHLVVSDVLGMSWQPLPPQ
jgi:Tol biopolymer transport system component